MPKSAIAITLMSTLLLMACGQAGDLYLPESSGGGSDAVQADESPGVGPVARTADDDEEEDSASDGEP